MRYFLFLVGLFTLAQLGCAQVFIHGADNRQVQSPANVLQRIVKVGDCSGAMVGVNLVLTSFRCLRDSGALLKVAENKYQYSTTRLRIKFWYTQKSTDGEMRVFASKPSQEPWVLKAWWGQLPFESAEDLRGLGKFNENYLRAADDVQFQQNDWAVLKVSSTLGKFLGYFEVPEAVELPLPKNMQLNFNYWHMVKGEAKLIGQDEPCRLSPVMEAGIIFHSCDLHEPSARGAPLWVHDESTGNDYLIGIHIRMGFRSAASFLNPDLVNDKSMKILRQFSVPLKDQEEKYYQVAKGLSVRSFAAAVKAARAESAAEAGR